MEAYEVRTVKADLLDVEVLRLAVEDCKAAATSTRRHSCCNPKEAGPPPVNCVGEFDFLQYATINLSLRHPAKR